MSTSRQERETEFRRLKQSVTGCWGRLEEPDVKLDLLTQSAEQFIGWPLPEKLGAGELLEQLETAAVLSPNSVGLLETMCDIVDCKEGSQLVQIYQKTHPPVSSGGRSDGSSPCSDPTAPLLENSDQLSHKSRHSRSSAERFSSDFDPLKTANEPFCDAAGSESAWTSKDPSATDSTVLVMTDSRESSVGGSTWRSASPQGAGGGLGRSGSTWPPLESVQYQRLKSAETEESRRRSMALWGRAPPSRAHHEPQPAPPPHAVCECFLPHVRPAPRHRYPGLEDTTVEQVLDRSSSARRPSRTNTRSSSSSGPPPPDIPGVTPSGARRARLVDFLSQRLGSRYQQLGEQLISGDELAAITADTSSDLVSRARRVLHLFLGRHGERDGDVELTLVRRLRRIRCNRLADELELWSADQDRWEDPRDWPEDKIRWREGREEEDQEEEGHGHRHCPRHGHSSPVRIPGMACC